MLPYAGLRSDVPAALVGARMSVAVTASSAAPAAQADCAPWRSQGVREAMPPSLDVASPHKALSTSRPATVSQPGQTSLGRSKGRLVCSLPRSFTTIFSRRLCRVSKKLHDVDGEVRLASLKKAYAQSRVTIGSELNPPSELGESLSDLREGEEQPGCVRAGGDGGESEQAEGIRRWSPMKEQGEEW